MKRVFAHGLVGMLLLSAFSCTKPSGQVQLFSLIEDVEGLEGKAEYKSSPYVTAGDRVYMVGHQDGTFPDLGWHVQGEMGGIWNHPIKLMDGFTAAIGVDGNSYCLDKADTFINYPFANKHVFNTAVPDLEIQRFQFAPDGKQGLVVEFSIVNTGLNPKTIGFEFAGHTDLMPVWLGERLNLEDHPDQLVFDEAANAWIGKDQGNEWWVMFGGDRPAKFSAGPSATCSYQPQGKGTAGRLGYELILEPQVAQHLRFFIAGSHQNKADLEATLGDLKANAELDLLAKRKHYESIAATAKVSIPDKDLEKAFEWVKYNTEWLVRDVPEIGRGLAAGMPDYPWWFGVDNEYTLKGAIATGRKDLVYSTIDLIHKLSEANGNGRIMHETSTNGVVFNPGNINETPQFASLIWWVYQWTGDKEFLEKYFPTIQKGLQWLMAENDKDGNLFPDGYGMMEIHGLASEMIDVAVYTQKAFADAAQMAEVLGKPELAKEYNDLANQLKQKINEEFWVEDFNGFADFIGTPDEALHLIDAAIVRADTLNKPWAVQELKASRSKIATYPKDQKRGFVVFHNWVVNTPMEMGIADSDKAIRALDKAKRFTNPFGVYVTGIDRDEAAASEDGSFSGSKSFSYTGAVMTLPTGVSAIGENNYGRQDEALSYLKRMTMSFGFALPGSIYEVSPDYGMMAQAWNLYSYGVPIVNQFFGIRPDAGNKVIYIRPQMPSSWQEASIEKVLVGDNEINLQYSNKDGVMAIEISQKQSKWGISIEFPEEFSKVRILGKEISSDTQDGYRRVLMSGKKMRVEAQK
jgi:glycogen debranching enzyme